MDIKAVYEEIDTIRVVLPQDPQLGPEFYRDLLTICRAGQDRVGDLIIMANRDFSRAKIQQRGIRKSIELAGPAQAKPFQAQLLTIEDELDELKYLLESLRVKKSNLAGASSDIRLTVGIIDDQVRLGAVKKPEGRPNAEAERTGFRPPAGAGRVTSIEDLVEKASPPADAPAKAAAPAEAAKPAPAPPAVKEPAPAKAPAAEAAPKGRPKEKAPEVPPVAAPAPPPAKAKRGEKARKAVADVVADAVAAGVGEDDGLDIADLDPPPSSTTAKQADPAAAVDGIEDIEAFLEQP